MLAKVCVRAGGCQTSLMRGIENEYCDGTLARMDGFWHPEARGKALARNGQTRCSPFHVLLGLIKVQADRKESGEPVEAGALQACARRVTVLASRCQGHDVSCSAA